MNLKKTAGDQGETLAGQYLERRGYTILNRQWRCRFGELDLVARSPEGVHGLDSPARFDVAEVYEEKDGGLRVVYLEDAFA